MVLLQEETERETERERQRERETERERQRERERERKRLTFSCWKSNFDSSAVRPVAWSATTPSKMMSQ